jgi:hypothetical protein
MHMEKAHNTNQDSKHCNNKCYLELTYCGTLVIAALPEGYIWQNSKRIC